MSSTPTSDATPRLLLDSGALLEESGHGQIGARTLSDGMCSPAGLRGQPWLARLRHALEHGLFVLHFQPIMHIGERRVSHHEALVRLADEAGGQLVAPGRFLPAAERYGLIRELDRMVLEEVLALLAAHTDAPDDELAPDAAAAAGRMRIAVNVSALSVTDPTMLAFVERRLQWHGVDPAALIIEVTETAAISDMEDARIFCAGVLQLGCGLALDDFGAGFGSFQYLKHLPFSQLKIDGDFIRRLPVSRTDQLLVKALAGVVRGMGAETIAEFVGDETTLEMLDSYGVDYAQGFAIGRPQPGAPLAV
jgi:EAL domain-containing protein (putative c-di-GMP-specific phosphodiesterase class I)